MVSGPNFIIAGAPKCGTTALFEYLSGHPQVFLTEPKEPLFYAEDIGDHREIRTRQEYERLFRGVRPHHRAVGEASVWYLHSSLALGRVRKELPDTRLIVLLRQPIDFLRSLHHDLQWICFEDEPDFEKAWALQETRRAGHRIPRWCQVPWFLDYRFVGSLDQHVARLFNEFPREQIKVMLFDDFVKSPAKVYDEVLAFLNLPSDGRTEFPRVNSSKRNRLSALARLQATVVQSLPRRFVLLCKHFGMGKLSRAVSRWNSKPASAPPLREEFRQHLIAEFSADIDALSERLGRDLSHWKR